jgi:hypothetical protein
MVVSGTTTTREQPAAAAVTDESSPDLPASRQAAHGRD